MPLTIKLPQLASHSIGLQNEISKAPCHISGPANWLFALALLFAVCAPVNAQQAETKTVYESKRTAHKVGGWEHGLIKRTPNLGKYYWTPMTEYTQNKGSRRTGKGVQTGSPTKQLTRHYVKPKFVPLPKNDRAQYSASQMTETRSAVSAKVRFDKAKDQLASRHTSDSASDCSGVLTYGDKEKGDGYSYKRQDLSVTGRLYGQKKKSVNQ